jgi:hypothetical protein
VLAHAAAAEAPLFGLAGQCVQVVDKRAQDVVHVAYNVAFDDTAFMQGDIMLPDAKTHQFFAFRGALFEYDFGYELYPVEPERDMPVLLPLWISSSDVKRAAQATNTLDGTAFSESDIPEGAVLDANVQLKDTYLRVSADDARVPITLAQALKGVDWPLADVPPGLYTFAGYIFSPPYNGWSPRAELIEIVDGAEPGPAAALESIEGPLFAYQGRVVRGCVSAPAGSQIRGSFTVLERPESGWMEWMPSHELAPGGQLELCFHDPHPELTGSVRLRIDVTAPDGTMRSFYTPDTSTVLQGRGRCTPSATVCCPEGSQDVPDPCAAPDAPASCAPRDGSAGPAGAPDAGSVPAMLARHDSGAGASGEHADASTTGPDDEGGCAVRAPLGAQSAAGSHAFVLWLAFTLVRLTRGRRHRTTAVAVQSGAGRPVRGHAT